MNIENNYISIKKAAKLLNVSELTLRNWDNSGKFPASRHPINNYRVYSVKDIDDLLSKLSLKMISDNRYKSKKNTVRKITVKHLTD